MVDFCTLSTSKIASNWCVEVSSRTLRQLWRTPNKCGSLNFVPTLGWFFQVQPAIATHRYRDGFSTTPWRNAGVCGPSTNKSNISHIVLNNDIDIIIFVYIFVIFYNQRWWDHLWTSTMTYMKMGDHDSRPVWLLGTLGMRNVETHPFLSRHPERKSASLLGSQVIYRAWNWTSLFVIHNLEVCYEHC